MPIKPTSGGPKARSRAAAKPMLTPTKRRELLTNRLETLENLLNRRADVHAQMSAAQEEQIDRATALILNINRDDLVRTWCAVADESLAFSRVLDPLLTGGIYGEAAAVTLSTLLPIALVRGWIAPENLPGPVRALIPSSMFVSPSEEVQEEQARQAQQAAAGNGKPEPKPEAAEDTEKPPATPRGKPTGKSKKQTDDKK